MSEANNQLHHAFWMIKDALRHAAGTARRHQEATEGTSDTMLFNDVANAIGDFMHNHPSMLALGTASLQRMKDCT